MMSLSEALSFRSNIMPAYRIDASKFRILAKYYFFLAYQEVNPNSCSCAGISVDTILDRCNSVEEQDGIFMTKKYFCTQIAGCQMSLGIELCIRSSIVLSGDSNLKSSYQGWLIGRFKTYDTLLQQAAKNAGVDLIASKSGNSWWYPKDLIIGGENKSPRL